MHLITLFLLLDVASASYLMMDLGATSTDPGCADIWPLDNNGNYNPTNIETMCSDAYSFQSELRNKNKAGNIEMQILGCFDPKDTSHDTAQADCKGTVEWPADLGEVDLKMKGGDVCAFTKDGVVVTVDYKEQCISPGTGDKTAYPNPVYYDYQYWQYTYTDNDPGDK